MADCPRALTEDTWQPQPRYEPTETGISARSCGVPRRGNPGSASIQPLSNASSSMRFARSFRESLVNFLQSENQRQGISFWHRWKKTMPWRSVDFGLRAWRARKPMLCLSAVSGEDCHPLEFDHESGRRLCDYWGTIFRHVLKVRDITNMEILLRYVQKALDDIRWVIDQNEFDELMAKMECAPCLDGIPDNFYWCAGGVGSRILFCAFEHLLVGRVLPAHFVESGTVFSPWSSDVDNDGRIVSLPEALRPLTLCNCDCKLVTSAICQGLHWYTMRCIHSSQRWLSSLQMTDNIFEIETTALDHVACPLRVSGIYWRIFPLHILVFITLGSSICWRKQSCLSSSTVFYLEFTMTAVHASNSHLWSEGSSSKPGAWCKAV